ncbi:sensor histidine kinase [Kushneria avicenniae]|uniref:sensor histidine kinase n=1 Tax=Kushneria avicenniae TaxID=402385 RepID=UPI0015873A4A|nr:ATP-binding protein [Kushneria avicenniae]
MLKRSGCSPGLHQRLLLWLLILLGALWVVLWANHYGQAEKSARRDIDDRLRSAAMLIVQLHNGQSQKAIETSLPSPLPATAPSGSDDDRARLFPPAFELFDRSRQLIARSDNFPDTPMTDTAGFENRQIDGETWRLYTSLHAQGDLVLRVAFAHRAQEATSRILTRDFGSPLLWLLPGLALAALLSVWQGLAPLRRLTVRISRVDPEDPKPLAPAEREVPRELQPLVHTLDNLLTRMRNIYARQRAFTASAAHELRTPLAGCLAQLRLAQLAHDAPRRTRALERMRESLGHMTRLIRRMLLLARLDRSGEGIETQPVTLQALIQEVIDQHEQTATEAGVRFETRLPSETLTIDGEPALLNAMLTNLVDNALRVSPRDSSVVMTLETAAHDALLTLRDHGCGISPEERERVFDPFHQGNQGSDSGSGLGLTIAHAIVAAHQGSIDLDTVDGGGTVVRIRLPCHSASDE